MSNPTIKIHAGPITDGEWNDVGVEIGDDGIYTACVHVGARGIGFGDSLGSWASDGLIDRVAGDSGLIGRIQVAIRRALA